MTMQSQSPALAAVVKALRSPRDEAEWTRLIAAVASDPGFAHRLASLLANHSPRADAATALQNPPNDLRYRCERSITSTEGDGLGRVDLVIDDEAGSYYFLIENKLGSDYGHLQLERYAAAVEASGASRTGLIAITATTPLKGEEAVEQDPHWLGSIRWSGIFDALRSIPHANPAVAAVWQASLDVLREQGDFGPMDARPELVHAWSRRDEAERLLFGLLRDLVKPTLAAFAELGQEPAGVIYRGKKQRAAVWPHRNRAHLKFRVGPGSRRGAAMGAVLRPQRKSAFRGRGSLSTSEGVVG
jgi:hypothetical protein